MPRSPRPERPDTRFHARPRERLYVVFGYLPGWNDRGGPPGVTVLGTVRARTRHAAEPAARALAAARPGAAPNEVAPWAVRWWASSACRRDWVFRAFACDGAALLAAERG